MTKSTRIVALKTLISIMWSAVLVQQFRVLYLLCYAVPCYMFLKSLGRGSGVGRWGNTEFRWSCKLELS
ncbi:hypothetical protein CYLTODRAFT_284379 [Cylindrobasidium torrendii FP15055 ss-10]|uniref:Uncharacterized protein n=1 Tax=Cylindrobasidium torrendii FP15055 ss-10 TaxID=1314674 RepID=A0A0D7BRX6_9AGAR|nr:hypothetical protein CYLTODRAFT_284379 [Cylindrobasidium torrendii FP15055 ss-10]